MNQTIEYGLIRYCRLAKNGKRFSLPIKQIGDIEVFKKKEQGK